MSILMNTLAFLEKGFYTIASAVTAGSVDEYDLMVIDDEATPLSAGPLPHSYYPAAVATVIFLLALTIFTVWIIRRNTFKARLLELRAKAGDTQSCVPFTIRGIRDAVKEAEKNLVQIQGE